ncbi:MAG: hypothetical protein JET69_00130 [Methanomassiliicoccales archaeon]|nr:hypothetical protein [Methanomassiliicoccales archaeon]
MVSESYEMKGQSFMYKLNTDTAFRNQFLDHPVETAKEFGIYLTPEMEKDLEDIVAYLKNDIKHIFEIPAGYKEKLEAAGFAIFLPPRVQETHKIIP